MCTPDTAIADRLQCAIHLNLTNCPLLFLEDGRGRSWSEFVRTEQLGRRSLMATRRRVRSCSRPSVRSATYPPHPREASAIDRGKNSTKALFVSTKVYIKSFARFLDLDKKSVQ